MAALDRWFSAPHLTELLDGDSVDDKTRWRVLRNLDGINVTLGNYASFWRVVGPHVRRGGRLLDLACGQGGFAIEAATRSAQDDLRLDILATDIDPASLAYAARAAGERPGLRFALQDALNLSNHDDAAFDVVTSTQALHHFHPEEIVTLIREAVRVSRTAVVLIDGARSVVGATLVVAVGAWGFRDPVWIHDTVVSFRRFYVPEELELLARIAVPGACVSSCWVAPGHVRLVVSPSPTD